MGHPVGVRCGDDVTADLQVCNYSATLRAASRSPAVAPPPPAVTHSRRNVDNAVSYAQGQGLKERSRVLPISRMASHADLHNLQIVILSSRSGATEYCLVGLGRLNICFILFPLFALLFSFSSARIGCLGCKSKVYFSCPVC
jgi:hypothetical protein